MPAATDLEADPTATPGTTEPKLGHRADLDGLRAVAIVVVVLFHAHVRGIDGGFVGVDVFIVLSGWLITRQLVAPTIADGTPPGLLSFWSRRARRLVPAMAVMVAVTFLASLVILSPLEWSNIAERGIAAALYGSNVLFAVAGGNYFAGPLQDSPFLHTWSLALEEQFYVVWPLVVWVVARAVGRRSPAVRRRALAAVMAAIAAASFGVNVALTTGRPLWAYYLLPGRAWQFAIGGLAAVVAPAALSPRSRWWSAVPLLGLVAIAVATLRFTPATPWPGVASLLPAAGALALITGGQVAGARGGPVDRVLSAAPLQSLGRLSYSWYLWHWPFMVLGTAALDRDDPTTRLLLGVAALPVAVLSLRLVETPLRRAGGRVRPVVVLGIAAVATLLLVAGGVGLDRYTRHELTVEPYRTYEQVDRSFEHQTCTAETVEGVGVCATGDRSSTERVVVVGDSHALQWTTAFGEAGARLGLRVEIRQAGNCTAVAAGRGGACAAYDAETLRFLRADPPAAVVISDARASRTLVFPTVAAWGDAYRSTTTDLASLGVAVGHVVDNPTTGSPMICLARGRSRTSCSPPTSTALAGWRAFHATETEVYAAAGGPVLDVTEGLCSGPRCELQDGDVWIWSGSNHLNRDFTLSRADAVDRFLRTLVPG